MANDSVQYQIIFSTKAQKEITVSWLWYEERQAGLGDRFYKEVINRLQQIESNPERYPTAYRTFRSTMIDTFPFLLIYRINKKQKVIRVVSVFHTSRNPKKKF